MDEARKPAGADDSLTVVIFGATGDLAKKKLLPALMDLFCQGRMLPSTRFVGVARQVLSHEAFQDFAREALQERTHEHAQERVDDFLSCLRYQAGDFRKEDAYRELAQFLQTLDEERDTCSSKLYYLSVPPSLYGDIFEQLHRSGLSTPCVNKKGEREPWVRIAVEKPFGSNLETAQELDATLARLFQEEQIFRIDHYLAKEVLENILAFRFSNTLFSPAWCGEYIESVHITFFENFGVEDRGAFYDGIGGLRDVGQNHMLQMLAFIAMEDPGSFAADDIRKEREKALRSLVLAEDEVPMKGQYEGYQDIRGVAKDSTTETYFRAVARIENDRWKGVPFVLEGGKAFRQERIGISIRFKEPTTCAQTLSPDERPGANEITFCVNPDETIRIAFWAKQRGFSMAMERREFCFDYRGTSTGRPRDAYEKLLLAAIEGDQTVFTTSEEVRAAWRFIMPVLEGWSDEKPFSYPQGLLPEEIGEYYRR